MSAHGAGEVEKTKGTLADEALHLLLIHGENLTRLSVSRTPSDQPCLLPGLPGDDVWSMSLVQIYLDAVTHQVITSEELAYVAGHQDLFDRTEQKLSARLEHLISSGNISVGFR